MKSLLFALFLFPLSVFAADIQGTYNVRGSDPYQKATYTGTATIQQDANQVYQIDYTLSDGSKYQGTGFVNNDQFSFVFNDVNPANKNHIGVQVATISEKGLEGKWVLLTQNLVGTETLSKKH